MGDLVTMPAWQPIVYVLKPQSWVPVLLALSDCWTVRRTVGLSDCRKDCRTVGLAADSGRQCESVSPWTYCRTTVGMTVGMTVGLSEYCRTLSDEPVGLSDRGSIDQVLQQHAQPVRARVPFEQLSFSCVG